MYQLKAAVSHADFLKRVKDCRGEVLFETADGDVLNLKSQLSQFVFAASFLKPEIVQQAQVRCEETSDYEILRNYLSEAEDEDG